MADEFNQKGEKEN